MTFRAECDRMWIRGGRRDEEEKAPLEERQSIQSGSEASPPSLSPWGVTMESPPSTGREGRLAHSSSDPAIQRRVSLRSLVRQERIQESENSEVLGVTPMFASSSEQSIALLTHNSSVHSGTPLGDLSPHFTQASDGRTHVLLHNVGRTIQRTGSQLRKTKLFHIFYLLVLPIYTVLGAIIFRALDGEHDERLRQEYEARCQGDRGDDLMRLQATSCSSSSDECFLAMKAYLNQVEHCYRRWHQVNRTVTHSMDNFSNALIYAFSVYTTIGFGNMAADTTNCRIATIFYGALGIPLFFAFVKEEGNLCRELFITLYKRVRRIKCRLCKKCRGKGHPEASTEPLNNGNCLGVPNLHYGLTPEPVDVSKTKEKSKNAHFARRQSNNSLLGVARHHILNEQRKVFIAGVSVFILYILLTSWLVMATTDFDYFTAMYFLFNSVALIGFGDVFPSNPEVILLHSIFMIMGVVLFSMCYFILQEEIREKAFEASRKARMSISKYGHTIIAQARSPWSRRNSPLFDGHSENGNGTANPAGGPSNFERLKKRRQSAPAIALTAPGGKTRFRDI